MKTAQQEELYPMKLEKHGYSFLIISIADFIQIHVVIIATKSGA